MKEKEEIIEKRIKEVIKYFTFFSYTPSFDEIHTFLPLKITKKKLKKTLDQMVKKKELIEEKIRNLKLEIRNFLIYTLPPHRIFAKEKVNRADKSLKKIKIINFFVKILSFLPQIKLIGISGSLAMMNARKDDDIDLFIITERKRLWTGRLIVILITEALFLRRRRGEKKIKDKVCLNLFFDERDLTVPKAKQNSYVAHEILQMKPLVSKNNTYERFLKANQWVFKRFPNAEEKSKVKSQKSKVPFKIQKFKFISFIIHFFGDEVEKILKKLQRLIIKRHQTTEIVTETQLWFFPKDFENILKEKKII